MADPAQVFVNNGVDLAAKSALATKDLASAGFDKLTNSGSIGGMISGAFDVAIAIGTVLAVLRIIYAGWLYMGWADAAGEKSKGKEVFSNAVIGLILLYGIWLILNQINPDLTKIRILEAPAGTTSSAGNSSVSTSNAPAPLSPAEKPLDSGVSGSYNSAGSIPASAWCYNNSLAGQYKCFSSQSSCQSMYPGQACEQTGKNYQDGLTTEQYNNGSEN